MFDAIREILHCKSLIRLDNVRGAEGTVRSLGAPRGKWFSIKLYLKTSLVLNYLAAGSLTLNHSGDDGLVLNHFCLGR